ncbi:MAG TPA: glycoside hydrolase family 2 protein, partial [Thermoprotei archaeon]|nr:glycoside hydrolase family 2 protein [Thermoprotei archaeon]
MAKILLLNGKWKFKWFKPGEYLRISPKPYEESYDDYSWLDCRVPGDVHTYLLEHRLIEDPFFERNAEKCRWVEEVDWWFRKEFYVPEELKSYRVELVFEGLDTFATVWLNGEKIAEHEDMFLPLAVDVTDKIKFGEKNVLVVKLASPLLETHKRNRGNVPVNLLRAWARKAQYAYGWDWATRLLTVGIWRDVKLVFMNSAKIRSTYVRTLELSKKSAKILVEIEVESFKEGKHGLVLKAECRDSIIEDSFEVELERGTKVIEREYCVENPYLWWPRGYGEQNLYDLVVELYVGEEKVDRYSTRFGIRTVELVTKG